MTLELSYVQFSYRYGSRVVIYDRKSFLGFATGDSGSCKFNGNLYRIFIYQQYRKDEKRLRIDHLKR